MKIEKIKQHLFLNDIYPAILLEDNSILIMFQLGQYLTKDAYLKLKNTFPSYMNEKDILQLFDNDYSNI